MEMQPSVRAVMGAPGTICIPAWLVLSLSSPGRVRPVQESVDRIGDSRYLDEDAFAFGVVVSHGMINSGFCAGRPT